MNEIGGNSSSLEINAASSILGNVACGYVCSFSDQNNQAEVEKRSNSTKKLAGLIIFYALAMAIEIIGGIKSNSLAVLTDAAHMFSDVAGFAISLFAVWAAGWNVTSYQSFGFHRIEVLAALLSIQLIWLISGMLMYEAVHRILHDSEVIDGKVMFSVAAFGFVINVVMITWLGHDHSHHHHHHHHHHHQHHHHNHETEEKEEETGKLVSSPYPKTNAMNINLQGAYLHVLTDMIQSVGVMISGAVIWAKPNWVVIDLLCTSVFSIIGLISTIPMLGNVLGILMERTPREIDVVGLRHGIRSLKGVFEVHDLHVWSITAGKTVMSCHVMLEIGVDSKETLHSIRQLCEKSYRIHHVTVQIEQE
ncbi:metal tolerance protein B [Silene latifolia]|uniref:metal tolerance protein B n=1 Tax=Silene latifolia TaxID=37657 RepID=UPI003D7713B5